MWGGGAYRPDAFYDACDALGLLVLQDAMFHNGVYPTHAEFASLVAAELTYQARRLAHHPSLALWIGTRSRITCDLGEF